MVIFIILVTIQAKRSSNIIIAHFPLYILLFAMSTGPGLSGLENVRPLRIAYRVDYVLFFKLILNLLPNCWLYFRKEVCS